MGKEIGEVDSIFLGSIGTIVETSEMQRRAFNLAFEKCKIPWVWEQQNYIEMLVDAGGKNRLKSYAEKCNVALEPSQIEKIYSSKNSFFLEIIRSNHIVPRDGITSLLQDCYKYEVKVGWVTTANSQVVEALMEALEEHIDFSTFDLVTSLNSGIEPKPNPDIYRKSISQVGTSVNLALAIEDSESGFIAAHKAGLRCLVVPGQYKKKQKFNGADGVVDSIEDINLSKLEGGRALATVGINRK